MDVALTTNAAEEEIKSWINGGGALVGFGKDCFNYSFNEETGRLEGGDTVDHWMMGLSGGTQVTDMVGNTVKVSENAPDWLKSLEKGRLRPVSFRMHPRKRLSAPSRMAWPRF